MEAELRLPPPGGRFRPITILGSPGLKEVKMLYYSRRFFDADGFGVLPPSAVESCTNFLLQLSRVASDLTVLEVTFNGYVPPIGAALSSAVSTKTNHLTAFTSAEVPLLPKSFVPAVPVYTPPSFLFAPTIGSLMAIPSRRSSIAMCAFRPF